MQLPEGSISYSSIFDIYKYDNTLYVLNVTLAAEAEANRSAE